MKSIERSLQKYLMGPGQKVSVQEVGIFATEHGNDLVETLFKCLNCAIDEYTGEYSLDRLLDAFMYLNVIIANAEELDRKHLSRRLNKLSSKIERINKLHEANEQKDNKQFDFMNYLISEPQNISYIEFTFKKLPHIVNVKDKDGKSLFQTVISACIDSLSEEDEEKTLYFINLISLIQHQKTFKIDDQEKRNLLKRIVKKYIILV